MMQASKEIASTTASPGLVLAMAIVLAGCLGTPEPSGPHLRTVDHESGNCAGIDLGEAILRGDPTDPRLAWLEVLGRGRLDAVFPKGTTARFTPYLEVLGPSGQVVHRAGDHVEDYVPCYSSDWDVVLVTDRNGVSGQ